MNNRKALELLVSDAELKAEAYAISGEEHASEMLAAWNEAEKRCSELLTAMKEQDSNPNEPK